MGISRKGLSPVAMVAPISCPAGMKPTFTPVRNMTRPAYVYTSPLMIRSSWVRLKRRVISWKSRNMAQMGTMAPAGVAGAVRGEADAQKQHREDGPDAAQGHQAEAVDGGVLVAAHRGHAHAQRHNEGHRNGPCGHAAGVKGHRDKTLGREQRQGEDNQVEPHQQPGEGDLQQDAQQRHHQEQANPGGHGENQHLVGDGGHLPGQHRQIWLRYRNQHSQHKGDCQGDRHVPGPAHIDADAAAHRRHGHIHAQGEHPDPHNQHQRAEQEQHQRPRRQRDDGDAQRQHDGCDGQDGGEGLLDLFQQLRVNTHRRLLSHPAGGMCPNFMFDLRIYFTGSFRRCTAFLLF